VIGQLKKTSLKSFGQLYGNLVGSTNASYHVSVHLAKRFQRRRVKCEKLADDRHQVMTKAHMAFGKQQQHQCLDKKRVKDIHMEI
jgi:hypothetical protein